METTQDEQETETKKGHVNNQETQTQEGTEGINTLQPDSAENGHDGTVRDKETSSVGNDDSGFEKNGADSAGKGNDSARKGNDTIVTDKEMSAVGEDDAGLSMTGPSQERAEGVDTVQPDSAGKGIDNIVKDKETSTVGKDVGSTVGAEKRNDVLHNVTPNAV